MLSAAVDRYLANGDIDPTFVAPAVDGLAAIVRLLGEPGTPRYLALVPLKDLATSAVWLTAFLGRQVMWSGQVFRVRRDGRIVPVGVVDTEAPVFADDSADLRAEREGTRPVGAHGRAGLPSTALAEE